MPAAKISEMNTLMPFQLSRELYSAGKFDDNRYVLFIVRGYLVMFWNFQKRITDVDRWIEMNNKTALIYWKI